MKKVFKFKTEVWIYPSETAAWHFVTLPKEQAKKIKSVFGANSRGFGSLPVSVTIGKTNWQTSIFPEKRSESYILPIKSEVRRKEGISAGDKVSFSLEIKV